MLGIDPLGFPRGNAEELCVETVDARDEAAPAQRRVPRGDGVQLWAICGQLGDAIARFAQQFPKLVGRLHVARQATARADDGDRLVLAACGASQLGFECRDLANRTSQCGAQFIVTKAGSGDLQCCGKAMEQKK